MIESEMDNLSIRRLMRRSRARARAAPGAGVRGVRRRSIDRAAAEILADVRQRGDDAVLNTRAASTAWRRHRWARWSCRSPSWKRAGRPSRSAAPRWRPPQRVRAYHEKAEDRMRQP